MLFCPLQSRTFQINDLPLCYATKAVTRGHLVTNFLHSKITQVPLGKFCSNSITARGFVATKPQYPHLNIGLPAITISILLRSLWFHSPEPLFQKKKLASTDNKKQVGLQPSTPKRRQQSKDRGRHVFTHLLFESRRGKDCGSLNTPWWNLQSPVSVRAINVERDKTIRRDK